MPTNSRDVRRIQRRVSLQTKKRDAQQTLSENIIISIIDHQHALFKNKSAALQRVYALELDSDKNMKILNDWIYIASGYCFILFENDLDGCDELALEIFTAFYLILKFIFIEQRNKHAFINSNDQSNINILYSRYQDILSTSRNLYYQFIINYVNKLTTIDEIPKQQPKQNDLKSLDPNSLRNSIYSPSEFYPQSDLLEISSTSSDSSSNSPIIAPLNPMIKSIDVNSFALIDPKSLIVINIQSRSVHSTNRSILTLDPSLVNNSVYFDKKILPFLQPENAIVIFSKSKTFSDLENQFANQLIKNGFANIFWLEGGYYTFKNFFVKFPPNNNGFTKLPNEPKIPIICSGTNDSQLKPNLNFIKGSSPPPIPKARSLISSIDNATLPHQIPSLTNSGQSLIVPEITPPSYLLTSNSLQNQHPIYSSTENNFKKMSLSNSNRTMFQPSQPLSSQPLSVSPIPQPTQLYQSKQQQYKLPHKLEYKPIVTLRNLGSTCYINSMIQCLFSITKFREFFINDEKLQAYLSDLQGSNAILASGFHELFNTFYAKSKFASPPPLIEMNRFLSIIANLNPSYNIPNEQQDTSQFLYYIIDELHRELKFQSDKAQKLGLVTLTTNNDEHYYNWQLKTLKNEGFSSIQNLFNIKEAVVMKCNRCGYTSTRYDTSIMLHLSLKKSHSSLQEILSNNFLPEEMSSRLGNSWDCDGCNKAEKELEELQEKIEREHDTNLAHSKFKEKSDKDKTKDKEGNKILKRRFFRHITSSKSSKESDSEPISRNETPDPAIDLYSNTLTDKEKQEYNRLADIFTRERIAYRSVELVELPDVLVLCLSLFNTSQQDAKVNLKHLKFPETLNMEFEKCCRVYKLNSWIDHWGSNIDSGHYTATVEYGTKQWIMCDDDKVQAPQDKEGGLVRDPNVYLLFYEAKR
jgi:ubiquitin C-terminal hydrolase